MTDESLRAENARLQSELRRLRGTLIEIYNLAPVGSTIANLAAQALGSQPSCKADGSCKHTVAELAKIEGLTESAVYKAKKKADINAGRITHSDWNRLRAG